MSILDRVALLMQYLLEQRFSRLGAFILKILRTFAHFVKGKYLAKYAE